MKKLGQADVLRIMREEWSSRKKKLAEDVDLAMTAKVPGVKGEQQVISPELKVLHKKSGLKYTVDSVGTKDIILRTPEGEKFLVGADTLERDYELELK